MQWKQPKSFVVQKVKGAVDYSTVTRWFKKFPLDCKNLEDQAKSSRPKSMDSMLQAIEANLVTQSDKQMINIK